MARIVMVNTVCSGSHGRIMRDVRGAARREGHDVLLAYGRGSACDGDILRVGSRRDVLAHVALTRALDRHALGSRGATEAFTAALDAFSPDLLHLHNIHGYYLHAQVLFDYIRARSLPTLWTHHDCWALTGHCSHFVRADCDRWKTGCHSCPLKHEYPASYGLDASRENWRWKRDAFASVPTLRIATPSHWLDGVLAASYFSHAPRHVIPNGVDLSMMSPIGETTVRAQYGIPSGKLLLLGVASPFDARKGLGDALRVAELLGDEAHVLLVGLSDKQLKRLPPNVTGMRRTDGPEALVGLYNAADCLINPTYEDTYPTVNMEAMACGTPVAGYGVCGAAEQLEAPVGISVPVGDAAALANAARALSLSKPALTGACRAYAQAHFDRTRAVSAYMDVYHSMMGV